MGSKGEKQCVKKDAMMMKAKLKHVLRLHKVEWSNAIK